jgi:exodeoxyribonuclease-3
MMRVATWNINGLRARLDFLLRWLQDRQPDVVGLQELKCDEGFPHAQFEAAGYQALIHTQKAWNGVAILSRLPATVQQRGLPGEEEMGARFISARVGDLDFITIYCPNGKAVGHPDYERKLRWLDSLVQHLSEQRAQTEPLILCGDFNICPAALDSWNEAALRGTIFHTEQERQRFQHLLGWGFTDAYRHLLPTTQAFSWWDYRAGAFHKNQGLRIDCLLGTQTVLDRLTHIEIDREYRKKKDDLLPSDHAPVMADLK